MQRDVTHFTEKKMKIIHFSLFIYKQKLMALKGIRVNKQTIQQIMIQSWQRSK
jgi:hypothetical protein